VTAASQRDLEIGREHPNLITARFDEHIRKNGNRVLPLDNALEKLQFSQKIILANDKFHRRIVTSRRSGGPRFRILYGEEEKR
jgi:hypothetical protein